MSIADKKTCKIILQNEMELFVTQFATADCENNLPIVIPI